MIVRSTEDVPIDILYELSHELKPEFNVTVDDSQISLRSPEPPSWIAFLAEADWWIQALAAYSAIYIAELVKEGAKATWKGRGKIGSGLKAAGNEIWELASGISRIKSRLSKQTKIQIGTSEPNGYLSCTLEFFGNEADELAAQIALFIHHLPAVQDLITTEIPVETRALGAVRLTILDDSSLEVSWMDAKTFYREKRILSLLESGRG